MTHSGRYRPLPAPGLPGDCRPSYLSLTEAELDARVERALEELKDCRACPRDCGVDRTAGKWAACKTGRHAVVGSAFPHFGEEDCLRGWNGSGTIFFSHCNLRCVFCFHPDTLVASDRGLSRIADLFEAGAVTDNPNVRDATGLLRLRTYGGRWAPLVRAFRHHHSGRLIRLKPFSCPPLLLTANHRVLAVHHEEPEKPLKIPAGKLSSEHRLIVPKRRPLDQELVLDVREILREEEAHYKGVRVRMPRKELAALFAEPATSAELARRTGYHPAYIRKLRGQWRRGALEEAPQGGLRPIELVEEGTSIRFTTERRPGIPRRIPLDRRTAWLLGFYCAEGHVTSSTDRPNSHRLVFSLGRTETSEAEKVARLLRRLFGVRPTQAVRRTTITVEVGKASLALLFRTLCGADARSKMVPAPILRAGEAVIGSFLEGFLSGDGCDLGTHWSVTTVSSRLGYGLVQLGLLLGRLPSMHEYERPKTTVIEGRTVRQANTFLVKIQKDDPDTGRPRSRWKETESAFLIPIHRMDSVPYEGPVYNLEVDDSAHSYLAPFVAVGNCQNYSISQAVRPREEPGEDAESIAERMLALQPHGCHNINFVTPEHVVPQVVEALVLAIRRGLRLPVVYNTSAYDVVESLKLMEGLVDIYMPDFKYWSPERSRTYMKAEDYPEFARAAVLEMHRQVGNLITDAEGLARRGLIVRHLVMPGQLDETRKILTWVAEELGPDTYVNLMDQYYPAGKVGEGKYPELDRKLNPDEFQAARDMARELGLKNLDRRRPHRRLRVI